MNNKRTSPEEMLAAALEYADFNWYVFPVHGFVNGKCTCKPRDGEVCTNPGKHPATLHGFADATTDHAQIRAWFKENPNYNIGIATGPSELLIPDLDVKNGVDGRETWRDLIKANGDVDTLAAMTGGGGWHLYLLTTAKVRSSAGRLGPGLDVRAQGGYVVAPPSNHKSGRPYMWDGLDFDPSQVAEAPEWLVKLCAEAKAPQAAPDTALLMPSKVAELRSALRCIPADDREVWLRMGMALKSTGAGQQAYGIWTDWSATSDKFDEKDQARTWRSIEVEGGVTQSSLFGLAKEHGWVDLEQGAVQVVDVSDIRNPKPVPAVLELPLPAGILRTMTNYILETAPRPSPVLSAAAAISLCAAVLGRRVQGETGLRTNLQIIGVAPTGAGKDHPRKVIKNFMSAAAHTELLGGEECFSGQGFHTALARSPASLFLFDEFGLKLQEARDQRSGGNMRSLMSMLMKAFTSADTILRGPEYADQKARPRVDLEYPCAAVFATTTGETFFPALASKEVASGFLSRFLIVEAGELPEFDMERVSLRSVPADVTDWILTAMSPKSKDGNLVGLDPASPLVVRKDEEAKIAFRALAKLAEANLRQGERVKAELWSRAWEIADRLATIAACAAHVEAPVVTGEHADWACELVRQRVTWLDEAVAARMADSPYESVKKAFLRAITEAGTYGVPNSSLGNKAPFSEHKPRERAIALEDLQSTGLVRHVKCYHRGSKGRPADVWILSCLIKDGEDGDAGVAK